jgi:hypothetical protein
MRDQGWPASREISSEQDARWRTWVEPGQVRTAVGRRESLRGAVAQTLRPAGSRRTGGEHSACTAQRTLRSAEAECSDCSPRPVAPVPGPGHKRRCGVLRKRWTIIMAVRLRQQFIQTLPNLRLRQRTAPGLTP